MSVLGKLTFESDFVENAVFLTIRRYETNGPDDCVGKWRAERDRVYSIPDFQARAKAFRQLDEEWFVRLGLGERFATILSSFPILTDRSLAIRIRRALSRKDEGSELYVQGRTKTNLVKIQTGRLFEDDYLEKFLYHEWLRISDMLDPIFQYTPHAALSNASELEDNLIRDRYRILWDLYLSARLIKRGFDIFISLERQRHLIDKAFSKWTEEAREKMFTDIADEKYQTQSDLLKLARDETLRVALGQGGVLCPLCHFTSFDPVDLFSQHDPRIIKEIKKDNPDWNMGLGICQNCFDLYQSKLRVAI